MASSKPRARTCHSCGERTPHAYRLCDDCHKQRVVESRAAQGLPPTVEDPTVLRQVAQLVQFGTSDLTERVAS